MAGERSRLIKLFCPSLSKFVPFVAWEEQRLDLGAIAATFGIEPSTLKLNGHFISRGADLVASSVTWKSLLSFFTAKGLSAGTSDSDALVVDGRLSKVGSKRAHDPEGTQNGILNKNTQLEDAYSVKKLKLGRMSNSGGFDVGIAKPNIFSLKRKPLFEEEEDRDSPIKKIRTNRSNFCSTENEISTKPKFSCSFVGGNTKRMREDEMVLTSPSKKIQ